MFSAMPLGLAIHNKWDSISMATPPLHSLRMERPAYSTPAPVENTPSNNECRMVELRGAKIASFIVAGEEFICLPQAFDLFLKHLVGGLHTVYTKLKRLSISPVVCNVEQVRILRGIGAIQPGVNRCKLITRKDFETLYQDCTTATRPGRPPKRYPMLPPTTDYMSPHSSMRGSSGSHGLLNSSDFGSLHKRMRLDAGGEKLLHSFQDRRRVSCSPTNADGLVSDKDVSMGNASDIHSNATANLYLQAQQALRQQYQQATSQQLEVHHAAAAAGLNHLNMMMMSHPNFFSGGLPPSSMNMLSHVNQLAQNHNAANMTAAAAVAQIAASGGNIHQAAAAQAAAQVAASFAAAQEASRDAISENANEEKDSDSETKQDTQHHRSGQNVTSNGIGSDGRASPESSLSEGCGSHLSENSENALSASDSVDSIKELGVNGDAHHQTDGLTTNNIPMENDSTNFDETKAEEEERLAQHNSSLGAAALSLSSMVSGNGNQSSMQTLLTNIQGLLKVAADNARLQEKHKSFEIAELKMRLGKERQLREDLEKKVQQMSKSKDELLKRLKKERKFRKYYQEQLSTIRPFSQREGAENLLSRNSPLPTSDGESNRSNSHVPLTPPKSYHSPQSHSPSTETSENKLKKETLAAEYENCAETTKISPVVYSTSSIIGENANNNNRAMPRHPSSEHLSTSPTECSLNHHERRGSEHLPLADSQIFFKGPMLFQTRSSQ